MASNAMCESQSCSTHLRPQSQAYETDFFSQTHGHIKIKRQNFSCLCCSSSIDLFWSKQGLFFIIYYYLVISVKIKNEVEIRAKKATRYLKLLSFHLILNKSPIIVLWFFKMASKRYTVEDKTVSVYSNSYYLRLLVNNYLQFR